jgi:hypothetical protein
LRHKALRGLYYALLQLAQLDDAQDEHPEDIGFVEPSLDRETPLKLEYNCSTSLDRHSGHRIPACDPKTSFSNSESHFRHLNSNIGIPSTSSIPDIYRSIKAGVRGQVLPSANRCQGASGRSGRPIT